MWAVGQARAGRRRQARTDDSIRPVAGGVRGRGRRRANQNHDVTPGVWLTGAEQSVLILACGVISPK